jgi:OOP family OmpA-OmpF porin
MRVARIAFGFGVLLTSAAPVFSQDVPVDAGSIVSLPGGASAAGGAATPVVSEVQAADPFIVVSRSDPTGIITVAGRVPSPQVVAARDGLDVSALSYDSGSALGFAGFAEFAITLLEELSSGRASLRANVLTVEGVAPDAAAGDRVSALLAAPPAGLVLAMARIDVAESAVSERESELPAGAIENEGEIAVPAPEMNDETGPVNAVAVESEPETATPEPVAAGEATGEVEADFAGEAVVEQAEAEPAVNPDYAFSATRVGGQTSFSGSVPAASTAAFLASLGAADAGSLEIASGAPADFVPAAVAGLRALMLVEDGTLAFANGGWRFEAELPRMETAAAVEAQLALAPGISGWQVDLIEPAPTGVCRDVLAEFSSRNSILFNSGSATISAESAAALTELAQDIIACGDVPIYIEGHTDSDGDDQLNLILSVERAEAVVAALVSLGIDPARLYAVGYGESEPIADNATAEGKRQNRRIVILAEDRYANP